MSKPKIVKMPEREPTLEEATEALIQFGQFTRQALHEIIHKHDHTKGPHPWAKYTTEKPPSDAIVDPRGHKMKVILVGAALPIGVLQDAVRATDVLADAAELKRREAETEDDSE